MERIGIHVNTKALVIDIFTTVLGCYSIDDTLLLLKEAIEKMYGKLEADRFGKRLGIVILEAKRGEV